ncbi:hypothetical protein, partial [Salmonella enterica]|uniref:hypothetical protein n=1 Tax=Salmonella enterica TaxID=28901 RepID=UPI003CECCAEE
GILKLNIKNIIHPSEEYRDFPEQTRKIIFILMNYKISVTGLLFLILFSLNKLKNGFSHYYILNTLSVR